ncbi:MAG: hypothetical protein LBP69_09840 [Treponema sp.]|jgi:hypothetical protein|nr:hypothetical protein [Treponema sp.]
MTNSTAPGIMTVRELARQLGCHPETVKVHIRELFPALMRKTRITYLSGKQVTLIMEKMKRQDSSGECGGIKPINALSGTVTNLQSGVASGETAPGPDFKGVQTFDFNSKPVRTFAIDGDPWWVAKDVAEVLEHEWQPNLVSHVPGEWKGRYPIPTPGGVQEMLCLAEQGLYFFLARSDKPLAFPFQKWIAGEVIPSIRKTGGYNARGYNPGKPDLDHRLVSALNKSVQIGAISPAQFRSVLNIPREEAR